MVAHKILVTSPEAKFLFPFVGPFGALALDWDLASGLSIKNSIHSFYLIKCAGIIHFAPALIAQNTVYLEVRLRSRVRSKLH